MTALDDAHAALRQACHDQLRPTSENAAVLRSVMWTAADLLDRWYRYAEADGLRDLGDALTGATRTTLVDDLIAHSRRLQ